MNWCFLTLFLSLVLLAESREFKVDYENNVFLKDGKPFQYVSGCMHYFRVPRMYWRDRLRKMKACGLDAVQTYIPWNFHLVDGSYRFDGDHDVEAFIKLAQEEGLLVILRGFPYSDTEWDMGGLPSFLLKSDFNPSGDPIALRTSDQRFLFAVEDWLRVILPMLIDHLYNNGGPIIMVQIENEYGSYYAQDSNYLSSLYLEMSSLLNNNVVLFTTDGNGASYLEHGHINHVFQTVDFGPGTNVTNAFALLRKYQPTGPLVNSEYYTGWLDHWGDNHHRTSSQQICTTFDEMLAAGASVNFYMFTGGTNFGYWSGSNGGAQVLQVTTSYDYDSPISENGDTTEKYFRIQESIAKYRGLQPQSPPPNVTTISYGSLDLTYQGTFWDQLSSLCPDGPFLGLYPRCYENMKVFGGYVLYRTIVPPFFEDFESKDYELTFENTIRDHAMIYINQKYVGEMKRGEQSIKIGPCYQGDQINILVESEGRLCFGTGINDTKGIDGKVKITVGSTYSSWLTNWEMYPLNLQNMGPKSYQNTPMVLAAESSPAVYTGTLFVHSVADTFIDFSGGSWTSGYVFVNGFNLGKFQPKQGPQKTLYLPTKALLLDEPILHFAVFETSPSSTCSTTLSLCTINLIDHALLG